jgi:hypothetical protein
LDLETLLVRTPDEDETSYQIKRLYAITAKNAYGDEISAAKAVSLGVMVVNKIKYGLKYSPEYEAVIAAISTLI